MRDEPGRGQRRRVFVRLYQTDIQILLLRACVSLPAAGQTAWLGYGGHRGQQRRPRERSLVPRGRRASRGTRCFLEAGVHCSTCDTQKNINLITKLYYSASVFIHWVHFNLRQSSLRSHFYIVFVIKYDFDHLQQYHSFSVL